MSLWRQLRKGLAGMAHGWRDQSDEVAHYFAEALDAGLDPGDEERVRDRLRAFGWENTAAAWGTDLTYAVRRLGRTPGFLAAAVIVLALGIGVGTAMFSVVNAVLLRPLPYRQPEQLMSLRAGGRFGDVPFPVIQAWRARLHSFAAIGFWTASMTTWRHGGATDLVERVAVSKNLLSLLGIPAPAAWGSAPNTVILSHALWHLYLHDAPRIIGQAITLDGKAYTVVGILPGGVSFPPRNAALYTLFQPNTNDLVWGKAQAHLHVLGRLRPGVTLAEAQADLSTVEIRLALAHPGMMGAPKQAVASSYRRDLEGSIRPALGAVSVATVLVWLIACFSVAGLLSTRYARRRQELALRRALGAARWQLARPLLLESAIVGLLAAAAGWVVAAGSLALLGHFLQRALPFGLNHVTVSGTVLDVLMGITAVSVIAAGLIPALLASHAPADAGLNDAAAGGRSQSRLRDALVIGEIALALLLLAGAALMLRTIYALRSVPLGFSTRNIVTVPLSFPRGMFAHRDMVTSFDRPLLERVRALPGVENAALCSTIPLETNFQATMHFDGMTKSAAIRLASPDFPKVFGIPLLRGRWFNAQHDTLHTPQVAVVNQAFAARYYPGQHPIGSKKFGYPIVGILANVHGPAVGLPPQPAIYFSTTQLGPGHDFYGTASYSTDLAVRSAAPAATIIAGLRAVLQKLAPEVAPQGFLTMQELVDRSIGQQIFAVRLLSLFGLAALAIALAGLYGLLAYAVSQRTRELGIRMALGAERRDITRLVLGRAAWLVALGAAAGLVLAWQLSHLLAAYLYHVPAHDPWSLAAAAVLLAACSLAAAWLPARRAAQVDPMEALRAE